MIYLTQLIYVREGCDERFRAFEDRVLPLLTKHKGELVLRLRPASDAKIAGTAEMPTSCSSSASKPERTSIGTWMTRSAWRTCRWRNRA